MTTTLQLINTNLPPLHTSDSGYHALTLMNHFHIQHLPVVQQQSYLGIMSEYDIWKRNQNELTIDTYPIDKLPQPSVLETDELYTVVKLIIDHHLTLVPVLDHHGQYKGSITIESVLNHFAHTNSLREPGGIIILQMPQHRYALSELAHLVEINGAKVLNASVTPAPANDQLIEVSLKVNLTDIDRILATFERYDYDIVATHQADNYMGNEATENYQAFLNYINI